LRPGRLFQCARFRAAATEKFINPKVPPLREAPVTLTVIQARMGSTRLPGKALAQIEGRTALALTIDAVKRSRLPCWIVVATTQEREDDEIAYEASRQDVEVFRGSVEPLTRFAEVAEHYRASGSEPIVRVTADCPLLDPRYLNPVCDLVRRGHDYAGVLGAPRGRHAEAFTGEVLGAAHRWASAAFDREHVVPWMIKHGRCGWYRVTDKREPVELNTAADLERIRAIAAEKVAA